MPSLFKQKSPALLRERRTQIDREIAALNLFRDRIDRRIAYLEGKAESGDQPNEASPCSSSQSS